MVPVICPSCGKPATVSQTRYGRRDDCEGCGLHSWDGKPLVSKEIHAVRQHCHRVFDLLWKHAHLMECYSGSEKDDEADETIRRSARNRAYRYIAFVTGMPEPECHMSTQEDIEKLRAIYRAASETTQGEIRRWWKSHGEKWWAEQRSEAA